MEGADPHTISRNFLRLPRLVHRLGKWSLCQYQIIYFLLISCIKFLGGNTQLEQDYWHQLLPSEGGLCLRGILFCFILCLSVLYWYIYIYIYIYICISPFCLWAVMLLREGEKFCCAQILLFSLFGNFFLSPCKICIKFCLESIFVTFCSFNP